MFKNIIHGMCWCYDKLTWRDQITKILLVLTILLYPFNHFPYGPFLKLTLYPLGILFVLNCDRLILLTLKNSYFRYIAIIATLWFMWMLISVYFAIGLSAIERENVMSIINDVKRFVPWYTFAGCCFILPRDEIKILLYWAFVGLFGYCACYSILEYLHFAGVAWATDFLSIAIKGFMTTELFAWTGGNFWPPILWDSERYRSVFEEPAYFAVLLGFCILLFTYMAWMAKRNRVFWGNLCLSLLASVLLCQTRGAAGAISLAAASVVWILLALCFFAKMSRVLQWRMIVITFFLCGASFFTLTTQRHTAAQIKSLVVPLSSSTETSMQELTLNVPANESQLMLCDRDVIQPMFNVPVKASQPAWPHFMSLSALPTLNAPAKGSQRVGRRKTTRSIHLTAELNCIAASPIYGCGAGEYGEVMREALRNQKDKTHEINGWIARESPPPMLNRFTGYAVTHGIVGLVLFLSWFAFPIIVLWCKRLKTSSIGSCCIVPTFGLYIACQMTSANTEVFSYFLLMTIPLLFITDESPINAR